MYRRLVISPQTYMVSKGFKLLVLNCVKVHKLFPEIVRKDLSKVKNGLPLPSKFFFDVNQ